MASSSLPSLHISNQPKCNLRFRYVSETRNSHGSLQGRDSISTMKTYPQISLKVPEKEAATEFYAMVLCFQPQSDGENLKLSPYFLCDNGSKEILYKPLIKLMNAKTIFEYEFSLKNYSIARDKASEVSNHLKETYEATKKKILNFSELGIEDTLNYNEKASKPGAIPELCLGFSILKKIDGHDENDTYFMYCKPILSERIESAQNIAIHKICSTRCFSGDNVTLLVSCIKQKHNAEVIIYSGPGETNLEESFLDVIEKHVLKGNELEIHKEAAISFTIPEFEKPTDELFVKVRKPKTDEESKSVKIIYEHHSPPKRRRVEPVERPIFEEQRQQYDSTDNINFEQFKKSEINSIENDFRNINIKGERNADRGLKNKHDNHKVSILNEEKCLDAVIDEDKFKEFYNEVEKLCKSHPVLRKEPNSEGISLLHYVCSLNKSFTIRSLIGWGYKIYAQDDQFRTPLHVAIAQKSTECISVFEELLLNPKPFDDVDLKNSLKRMLSVYDEKGRTVLHRAVLHKEMKLVQCILDFCNKEKSNLHRFEVLGNGDTLLHLAISNGLIEMAKLIIEHDPEAIFHENYSGMAVIDDESALEKLELKPEV